MFQRCSSLTLKIQFNYGSLNIKTALYILYVSAEYRIAKLFDSKIVFRDVVNHKCTMLKFRFFMEKIMFSHYIEDCFFLFCFVLFRWKIVGKKRGKKNWILISKFLETFPLQNLIKWIDWRDCESLIFHDKLEITYRWRCDHLLSTSTIEIDRSCFLSHWAKSTFKDMGSFIKYVTLLL